MRHFELPIFADDRAHAAKLARLEAPAHVRDHHARVMGGRVAEIAGDLRRAGVEPGSDHDERSITSLVIGTMRARLRAARAGFVGSDAEFLVHMNEPWKRAAGDDEEQPPRLSVLFAGIPYHPNAITLEDVAEATK